MPLKRRQKYSITDKSLQVADEVEKLVFEYQRTKSETCFEKIADNITELAAKIYSLLTNKYDDEKLKQLNRYKLNRGISPTTMMECPLIIRRIILNTLQELAFRYKPQDSNSRFFGLLANYLFLYCLTNTRKLFAQIKTASPYRNARSKNYLRRSTIQTLKNCFGQLPLMQCKVLNEFYLKRLKYRTIAKINEIRESTVRNTKRIALKKIEHLAPSTYKLLIKMPR